MSATTYVARTDLTTINCGECGGVYAIAQRYHQTCYEEGSAWNCPYCKVGWGFACNNGENDRLRRQLKAALSAEQRERAAHDQTRSALEHTERRRRAEKAAKTRVRNRVAAGVCPCCNRTFQNLARHMQSQHPEVVRNAKGGGS